MATEPCGGGQTERHERSEIYLQWFLITGPKNVQVTVRLSIANFMFQ